MKCPACLSDKARFWKFHGAFSIYCCRQCGHKWTEPMPSDDEIRDFYAGGHHPAALDDSVNVKERRSVMRFISRIAPSANTLLDIGCGFGHYLPIAGKMGLRCTGVEPDAERAAYAKAQGHEVLQGFFSPDLVGGRQFDVVLLNHVIEHVREPDAMLAMVRAVTREGGTIFIACPNHASIRALIMRLHYEHYSPPEHLHYFTAKSLRALGERCGFSPIRIRTYMNPLQVKTLLAYILRLRFLSRPKYVHPHDECRLQPRRFVDGRARMLRIVVYKTILAASSATAPVLNLLGGDNLLSFWKKTKG